MMPNFIGAGDRNQLGERAATDAGEREVDDVGVAEQVKKKRLDGFQRVGSAELEQDYPQTPLSSRHPHRFPRERPDVNSFGSSASTDELQNFVRCSPGSGVRRRGGRFRRGGLHFLDDRVGEFACAGLAAHVAGLYGPNPVLLAAPLDTPSLLGMNLKSGELLFEEPNPQSPTLIGASGDVAVLAGAFIHGLDAATGKMKWLWTPPAPAAISGPSVLIGQTIYVPTTDKVFAVVAADGKTLPDAKPKAPNFRSIAVSESIRKLLEDAAKTFGPGQR